MKSKPDKIIAFYFLPILILFAFTASPSIQPHTVIFKVKSEYRSSCSDRFIANTGFNRLMQSINIISINKKFPLSPPPSHKYNSSGHELADISLIYELKYNAALSEQKVINALYATGIVEYAQPRYPAKPLYTPDDTYFLNQYYLFKMDVVSAWDITKGDTNVVIGIADTGNDTDHPDLSGKVKYNYADTLDGIDNDNDGFTDNFMGWDLGDNDYNPAITSGSGWLPHGSAIAGLIAAATDNLTGIAGAAFKCKYLPVKVSTDAGEFNMGYEGIVYAADHGCQVINCSWGGTDIGPFEKDIINYATINKNALIVSAAGNDGTEDLYYPASYDYVLSVAGTDENDIKYYSSPTNTSTYGIKIDLCAPGKNCYATYYDNNYIDYATGTSISTALASAAAAIVKSYRPWLNPMQITWQLKNTCDIIDTIPGNINYTGKLGMGRINLYRALTDTMLPAIALLSYNITDDNDDFFTVGDTLYITATFINYLAPATNVTASLSSDLSSLTVIDGIATLGPLNTFATVTNNTDPFKVYISPSTPYNLKAGLKLNYNADGFSSFEYIGVLINPDYIIIDNNALHMTMTSKGRIGYNDTTQLNGTGVTFNGSASLLYEAGLMIGTSSAVSDNVRGVSWTDNDFKRVAAVKRISPPAISDFDATCAFNDDYAGSSKLNVLIRQANYSWSATDTGFGFVVLTYHIINTGTAAINNLYAGIFSDWDIRIPSYNRAGFDAGMKMGYVYSSQYSSPYAGVKLLTPGTVFHYSIDNVAGGNGGVNPVGGFTSAEKFTMLSSNRHIAGSTGPGNDVIDVVSSGPFQIAPGDSAIVAFAILAADSLEELIAAANQVQAKFDSVFTAINSAGSENDILNIYPDPANKIMTIEFNGRDEAVQAIEWFSASGKKMKFRKFPESNTPSKKIMVDVSGLPPGLYFCRIVTDKNSYIRKFVIVP